MFTNYNTKPYNARLDIIRLDLTSIIVLFNLSLLLWSSSPSVLLWLGCGRHRQANEPMRLRRSRGLYYLVRGSTTSVFFNLYVHCRKSPETMPEPWTLMSSIRRPLVLGPRVNNILKSSWTSRKAQETMLKPWTFISSIVCTCLNPKTFLVFLVSRAFLAGLRLLGTSSGNRQVNCHRKEFIFELLERTQELGKFCRLPSP